MGSQCRPNECLFRVWETPGGWDFGWGARWAGEGNARVSLRATQRRGGRILSQLGGFQVSGKGNRGSKGNKGSKGSKGIIMYITYLSYVVEIFIGVSVRIHLWLIHFRESHLRTF